MRAIFTTASLMSLGAFSSPSPALANGLLTGDVRLACEAILCLSTGFQPPECSPALSKYFGINKKEFSDTLNSRLNFLNICPVVAMSLEMSSLVLAITRGAGRCDAQSLNSTAHKYISNGEDTLVVIDNQRPDYCSAYSNHSYTDLSSGAGIPRYVGLPERGGRWADAQDYKRAKADNDARIAREDQAREETLRELMMSGE